MQAFSLVQWARSLCSLDAAPLENAFHTWCTRYLICIQCREIIDTDSALAASLVENVAADSGYQIVGHRFDLYGLCPKCQGGSSA